MFGLHDFNCFFRAACALLDRWKTRPLMWKFRLFSSTDLNQSLTPLTDACRGMAFLPTSNTLCLPGGNRVQLMPCCLKGTFTTLFLILCVMQFPLALLQIPGQTAGQAAGFFRSTSGCGAVRERSPERSQWRMRGRC